MPTLSSFTPFSALTDGAPASASYFNAKFSTISTNLDQLNSDTSTIIKVLTQSGNTLSTGTLPLSASTFSGSFIGGQYLSTRTLGVAQSTANMAVNEVIFSILGASGASLAVRSGGTIWIFNSSLSTAG